MSELPCELELAFEIIGSFLVVDSDSKVIHLLLIFVHHGLRYIPTNGTNYLVF